MRTIFCCWAVLLLMYNPIFSQGELKVFPVEPLEFMKEMDKFMNLTKRDDCKQAFDAFSSVYQS
jgi:hypothetical protein